ncbi:hypothetical protein [Konateibacter massiliensis]|uniref:hypothetical protein n=1 Tax=Konateibacter massiliensis TaxID=2002841 RepID=UPI001F2D4ABF|nr:hypothetical protein [Konateibacter massiliensis]
MSILQEHYLHIKKTLENLENQIQQARNIYKRSSNECKRATEECEKAYEIVSDCQKMMNEICDVGVDVDFRDNYHSWAVVCIHGKMDFMKFVPLNHSDVREVARFLKQFEYSKRVVDSPFSYGMIEDLIARF